MKSEFLTAITQLAAEKNLSKEVVLAAVEAALVSAYKKESFTPEQDISVKINPNSGQVKVFLRKMVVETVTKPSQEISLAEARNLKKDITIGEVVEIEATPQDAGRIAVQTARQVILQRLHEAEHRAIYEEYGNKEGEIVTGVVQRIEPKQIFIDLGRAEAILPLSEQVPSESYRVGQRLKLYLLEVARTNKGPQIIVSRSHRNLVRRLFELEIPEIYNGMVEIKSIAREAGHRTKVAVAARQEAVDAVGCCVGLRGIRIQNILNELKGEKVDVVPWHPELTTFVANALSPAQVVSVELSEQDGIARVIVPDKQLSLAIGKDGQNARLAARLTNCRIDIRSVSAVEAQKVAPSPPRVEEIELVPELPLMEAPSQEEVEVMEAPSQEEVEVVSSEEVEALLPTLEAILASKTSSPPQSSERVLIRFAEDVLSPRATKSEARAKKEKRKSPMDKGKGSEVAKGKDKSRKVRLMEEDILEEEL